MTSEGQDPRPTNEGNDPVAHGDGGIASYHSESAVGQPGLLDTWEGLVDYYKALPKPRSSEGSWNGLDIAAEVGLRRVDRKGPVHSQGGTPLNPRPDYACFAWARP